jgi:hypothetical protein
MRVRRKATVIAVAVTALGLAVAAVALAGFKPAVSYPTGAGTLDVVLGDFNGDGKPDLAASNRTDNNVAILRGNGTGAFKPAQHYAAGTEPLGLLQGDWNGDGRDDLAVANQSDAGGVTIMLGRTGGFSVHHYAAGPGSSYVLAGRFTGDRRRDLAVSNLDGATVSILRGKSGGAFAKIGDLATGPHPFGLALADFNGDGHVDVGVTNDASPSATRVSVFRGRGDGTFRSALNSPAGVGANEMVVGRFNGDSIPDLAVTDFSSDEVDILIGTGTGSFKAPKTFPAGPTPADVALGDFNRDGKKDLAVTDSRPAGRVAILKRKAGLDFGPPITYPVGSEPYGLAVGRLNGDHRLDAATANYTGTTSVLQGN